MIGGEVNTNFVMQKLFTVQKEKMILIFDDSCDEISTPINL